MTMKTTQRGGAELAESTVYNITYIYCIECIIMNSGVINSSSCSSTIIDQSAVKHLILTCAAGPKC